MYIIIKTVVNMPAKCSISSGILTHFTFLYMHISIFPAMCMKFSYKIYITMQNIKHKGCKTVYFNIYPEEMICMKSDREGDYISLADEFENLDCVHFSFC